MATVEILDLSDKPTKADGETGVHHGTPAQGSPTKGVDEAAPVSKPDGPQTDTISASPSPASSSTSLPRPPINGQVTPGTTPAPTLSMPHPKKFSSVNINKKFLERSSSSTGSVPTASTSLSSKVGTTTQKPALQSTPSHSRLVTAKLTAGPQPSTVTGPGWSRPSSTGSPAPTPASTTNPKPSPLPTPATSHAPPAPGGKVILPQPRPAVEGPSSNAVKDASSKPAWRSSKLPLSVKIGSVQDDFPTAAESAQASAAKLNEKRQATQAAQAHKQALATEADAFRGVHLKNAHHWDEDEGDDADFLGGVIDFGDGRQYKIQPSEPSQPSPPNELESASVIEGKSLTKQQGPEQPVSKEERFADDFDRSWPRRPSETSSRDRFLHHGPPSSASSSVHSPQQDSSRVLFNERSNRLEPWSTSHHPRYPPRDSYVPRRDSRSDHAVSPTESRNGREPPPHRQGVQLLQKPAPGPEPGEGPPRSRMFGGDRFGDNARFRDREGPRRDYGPPPHLTRPPSQRGDTRERDHYNPLGVARSPVSGPGHLDDLPRRPAMVPPPLLATQPLRGDSRQVPPHLAKLETGPQPLPTRAESIEQHTVLEATPATASVLAQSPAPSLSPLVDGLTMPIVDIEEVRKAAMHSAAERAKLRRQQEEEEREREKERARKKAAEIEAKIKAAEEAKKKEAEGNAGIESETKPQEKASEAEVVEFIEESISSSTIATIVPNGAPLPSVPEEESTKPQPPPPIRTVFGRTPSTKGLPRTAPARRPSFNTSDAASPAEEANSWRSKAAPISAHPILSREPSKATSPSVSSVPPLTLHSLPAVDALTLAVGEEVEIVDFSELGKLVGIESPSATQELPPRSRPRPVATDFFPERRPDEAKENESWRRPPAPIPEEPKAESDLSSESRAKAAPTSPQAQPNRRLSISPDGHIRSHTQPQQHPPKSPTGPSYREAPMSTLDDTMARIRGALHGMHKPGAPKASESEPSTHDATHAQSEPEPPKVQPAKWLPPALRPKAVVIHDDTPREVFDVTASEPPRSPKPAWNTFSVKMPSVSLARDHIPRRQLNLSRPHYYVRADIYSFDPPIEGVNRRDFSLNDIFFRKPFMVRGQPKYTVSLPSRRLTPAANKSNGLVVNLPSKNPGAFGRKSDSANVGSWRKPPPSPLSMQPVINETGSSSQTLETVSRSPPPESSNVKEARTSAERPTVSVAASRSRSQPKMPAGADVAFYDSRAEELMKRGKNIVNFIVSSELEEESSSSTIATAAAPPEVKEPSSKSSNVESLEGSSESRTDTAVELLSPSPARSNNLPWPKSPSALHAKDSPSRAPDPEHLRAVWSSTAEKAAAPSVNSLEKIGDDLTPVPFTIQDVKSEDGETRPPSSSGPPSRMSLHEVTRAFQQVPHRTASLSGVTSPSSTHRQPHSAHAQTSVPTPSLRPMYPAYPSPMLSSPSPTMVYPMSMTPSPVPRPMVVPPPSQYPMWVPVPGPPPPGTMMRPMGSPYGPQLMPYPPGTPMYHAPPPANMQSGHMPPPQSNGAGGRPNGVHSHVISPVLQHAHASPMYMPSPILMHTPISGVPPGHGYPNAGQQPRHGQPQHAPGVPYGTPSHPPQGSLYNPAPSNSHAFERPTW